MENNDNKIDRTKFEAVWRRVMDASGGDTPAFTYPIRQEVASQTEKLRRFMDSEASDAQFYASLAMKCGGGARQTLLRISADEKCHLKKLRAKHFILTGETYTPPYTCPLIRTAASALRLKFTGEKEGSAAYRAAAGETADTDLSDTYLALSQDEARHAKTIGCIIENMM